MSNSYAKFTNNIPPKKLQIYWDDETKKWELWFGADAPMFDDADYSPFTNKLYEYKAKPAKKKKACKAKDCFSAKCRGIK
jgi:hypothetical protein